ncbi:MAG TPA: HAD hydrolase family protein [Thermoanaerobaculia bacterium]|jgi:3-deoxy-D-manno-octulosonate 8-phosphate phosphatase (KDO 8-P phosphatase)
MLPDDEFARRARALDWLLFDVDGVFTDGHLLYGAGGEQWKVFHVRDGLGLRLARRAGLKVGILSGRGNAALEFRAREIEIDALIQERSDKAAAFAEFLGHQGTAPERVAYMGDDILDLPVMRRCALSFAPADAVREVREKADRVLQGIGGGAVVREMCELILRARGDWDQLVAHLLTDS